MTLRQNIMAAIDRADYKIADPEDANKHRAIWAAEAVARFMKATHLQMVDGLDTAVSDLLVDLAHFCDRTGLDFGDLLRRAKNHYDAETLPDDDTLGEEGEQFNFVAITPSEVEVANEK